MSCPPSGLPEPRLPVLQTGEEHTVTHLQYVAWPDHGVPDDSSDFLEFVNYVRSLRVDAEPVLVHCRYVACWFGLFVCSFALFPPLGKGLERDGRRGVHLHPTRLDNPFARLYFFAVTKDLGLYESVNFLSPVWR